MHESIVIKSSDSVKIKTNFIKSMPPVRVKVFESSPTFTHIGRDVLFIGEVLKKSYHAFSDFFMEFWLQFFIRTCLLILLSVGIFYGLTELKSLIKLSNIGWRAVYFSVFTFELTMFIYLLMPVIISAICRMEPKYRHSTIHPSLMGTIFYYWIMAFILGSITFITLEVHLSLSYPFALFTLFAFPCIALFQLNPFRAIHISCQIFIRNFIPTLTLLIFSLFGSFCIGIYCWSLANYRLPLIVVGIAPAIPWIPFLFLVYSSIFTLVINTKQSLLRRGL